MILLVSILGETSRSRWGLGFCDGRSAAAIFESFVFFFLKENLIKLVF